MQICHVTSVHPAKDVRIFYKECCSLVKAGYDVYEIAPNVGDEFYNGVKICGVQLPRQRLKRMLFGREKIYTKCLEINADVYHFHDPELIPVGIKLKRNNSNKKIIFDSHEDVPAQILAKHWIPFPFRKLFSIVYSVYERISLKCYDAIISVTPSIVNKLKAININTVQITNYPIVSTVSAEDMRQWNNSICFAGGISQQWLHTNIIKALDNTSGIMYELVGTGSSDYLAGLKNLSSWSKVKFYGNIPFTDVGTFLSKSTAAIVLNDYSANVGWKEGTLGNNKLFEAMQVGIPVICTDFILWKEIIDEWKCGICINPHDITAIRDAINYLIENKDIAKEMGDNAKKAVIERYNWKTQETVLLNLYVGLFKD